MSKISEYSRYDIDDLIDTWNGGWGKLADLAEQLGFQREGRMDSSDRSWPPSARILWCSEEIIEQITAGPSIFKLPYQSIQALAAAQDNKYTWKSKLYRLPVPNIHDWSRCENRQLRKILKKVTEAFATCKTLGDVLSKIATPDNYKRFIKENRLDELKKRTLEELLALKIETPWPELMRWLSRGLKSKEACDEAWWNCVWLMMQPKVREMLEIKRRIYEDIPLTGAHIKPLNEHMIHGYPVGSYFVIENNGKKTYQVVLKADGYRNRNKPLLVAAHTLLVQPAFKLAQELQNRFSRPRFVKQCHAPSCRKSFYTQRESAVVCPSKAPGLTSDCRKEWFRYMRYLKNLRKTPTKDWNNPELIEYFLQQDTS
jgi:hypothetical protein